jgi:hypothetical protein
MRSRITLAGFAIASALGCDPQLQAEEWKFWNAGNFYFSAPVSWQAYRGDGPNSAMLVSANPSTLESYMFAVPNPFDGTDLPDMYGMMSYFQSIAKSMNCELGVAPDVGGRNIAGQKAIGAYAACKGTSADLRVYVTAIGKSHELLVAIQRYKRSSDFVEESYRYGLLDSIIIPKMANRPAAPGIYQMGGPYGGGTGIALYMGWLTVEILADNRYRMLKADLIGSGLNAVANLNEVGSFVIDGEDLILFSDSLPNWPEKDRNNQLPRRVTIR